MAAIRNRSIFGIGFVCMSEIGAYSPETARMILDVVGYLKRNGYLKMAGIKPPQNFAANPVIFRNDSGAAVPPYGCLQATGTIDDADRNFVKAVKPTDLTTEAGFYVFNTDREIAIDDYGICQPNGIVRAITDDKTASAGEGYRPIVDSFRLARCPGPFMMLGVDDIDPDCVRVAHSPAGRGKAKWIVCTLNAQGTLAAPTVNDYWEGEDPEACESVTLVDPLGMPCPMKNEKVLACYRPETDDYAIVSSKSSLLGTPLDVEVMVDADDAFRWSTGTCGTLEYATRTIKAFSDCGSEAEYPDAAIAKSIAWSGAITPVVVGASITTNGEGDSCLTFARAYALVCDVSEGTPEPLSLCGEACCDKSIYYKRYVSPGEIPGTSVYVGDYDYGYLTDAVAEECFVPAEAPAGWVSGSAEELGSGFTRDTASPECCPDAVS